MRTGPFFHSAILVAGAMVLSPGCVAPERNDLIRAEIIDEYQFLAAHPELKDPRVRESEERASFEKLSNLATAGDKWAQYQLAQCHRFGLGTERDILEANRWTWIAATNGNSIAQWVLGNEVGHSPEGTYWTELAAKAGHSDACYNLARLYLYGDRQFIDKEKGLFWLRRSVETSTSSASSNNFSTFLASAENGGVFSSDDNPGRIAFPKWKYVPGSFSAAETRFNPPNNIRELRRLVLQKTPSGFPNDEVSSSERCRALAKLAEFNPIPPGVLTDVVRIAFDGSTDPDWRRQCFNWLARIGDSGNRKDPEEVLLIENDLVRHLTYLDGSPERLLDMARALDSFAPTMTVQLEASYRVATDPSAPTETRIEALGFLVESIGRHEMWSAEVAIEDAAKRVLSDGDAPKELRRAAMNALNTVSRFSEPESAPTDVFYLKPPSVTSFAGGDATGLEFDFGEAGKDGRSSLKTRIVNLCDKTIGITGMVRSCECAELAFSPKRIPRSCSAIVLCDIDPNAFSGPFRKTFFLKTDDPDHPEIPVVICGEACGFHEEKHVGTTSRR